MDQHWIYEIRVEGYLSKQWSDWFDGLDIDNNPNGETILSGLVADQSALFGLLNKLQALHLTLVSVSRSHYDLDQPPDSSTLKYP